MFSADLGGTTPSAAPAATDPPFNKVALLLHGDGTNGAQNNTFLDSTYPGGYAVSFDGSGDTLSNTTANVLDFGTSDFTIEYWVFPATTASYNYAGHIGQATTTGLCVGTNGSGYIYATTMATGYTTTELVTIGAWQHIAWVRNGTTLKAYKNGVNIGTFTGVSTNFNSVGFAIGALRTSDFAWTIPNGFLSNLRVVKGTALYTSNFTPSNLPLTAVSGTSLLTCQSATIVDNSPNTFTITANGDAAAVSSKTITRTGNVAQGTFSPFSLAEGQWSNYFDGSGDYLTVASGNSCSYGTGDFTLETWIRPDTIDTSGQSNSLACIFDLNANAGLGTDWLALHQNNASLIFYSNSAALLTASNVLTANNWFHIAIVRNGTSLTIYVNGVSAASTTYGTTLGSTRSLYIGFQNYTGLSRYFKGYISNVRSVVGTAVYTSGFTPPTSALTAITNTSLLTCQSNRFKDNSSNNFTITKVGDTKVTAWSPFVPSTAYSAGTNGGSGYFDGSGDYLSTPSSSGFTFGTGDFTIESLVYWGGGTNFSAEPGLFQTSTTSGGLSTSYTTGVTIFVSSGVYVIVCADTYAGRLVTTYTPKTDEWHHVAIVRSGSTLTCYVNGINVGSQTNSKDVTATYCAVGGYYNTSYLMRGYLSNFRVVKGTAVYTTNFTPPTAPLTAVSGTQLLLNCTNAGIIDNSGKNDIETVGNAMVSTSVKKYGTGSMYFDGTGDYLKLPNVDTLAFGTGDFTIEMWVNPTSLSNNPMLYSKCSANSGAAIGWFLEFNTSGNVYFGFGNTSASYYLLTTGAFSTGSWQHLAAVRQGATVTVYKDGASIGTKSLTGGASSFDTTTIATIGDFNASLGIALNGYIDDLRITKGQALYTSNFTPPTQAFPNV